MLRRGAGAGSSSIRFALFTPGEGEPDRTVAGRIEEIGTAPHMIAHDAGGAILTERRWADGATLAHEALLGRMLHWVDHHLDSAELLGVGHRVVHDDARFSAPARVTPSLLGALEALCPLAPLHQPHNLAAIVAVAAARPRLPQVACFDTADGAAGAAGIGRCHLLCSVAPAGSIGRPAAARQPALCR